MNTVDQQKKHTKLHSKTHMPANSVFFEKAVPILLAVLGLIMVGLIVFAAGVLLGLIRF
jgi:hypothetical protein